MLHKRPIGETLERGGLVGVGRDLTEVEEIGERWHTRMIRSYNTLRKSLKMMHIKDIHV